MDIAIQLDQLADMQAHADAVRMQFDSLRESIIPDDIRAKLAEIAAEEHTALEAIQDNISQLQEHIKQCVITTAGATVKGKYLMAVWNKGRESWDGKLLSGYAVAHPEILQARKVGEPSVTIRKV